MKPTLTHRSRFHSLLLPFRRRLRLSFLLFFFVFLALSLYLIVSLVFVRFPPPGCFTVLVLFTLVLFVFSHFSKSHLFFSFGYFLPLFPLISSPLYNFFSTIYLLSYHTHSSTVLSISPFPFFSFSQTFESSIP